MPQRLIRALIILVLAFSAGGIGYTTGTHGAASEAGVSIPAQTIANPEVGKTRVIYSLDSKQTDQELIALINEAEEHIYFAIYTFTLSNVADALVAAHQRGVDVKGIMDSEQSSNSYGAPVTQKLIAAGIPIVTENHASGNGIMHIKLLVTEQAYFFGSYNWTKSATTINDEIIEIGTDPALRQAYEKILIRLFEAYKGTAAAGAAATVSGGMYDFTEAKTHIGEYASVRGKVLRVYTAKSGVTFFDYCTNYKTCPFTAVIFADDVSRFGNVSTYANQEITLTGKIVLYEGRAEIILSDPNQITE